MTRHRELGTGNWVFLNFWLSWIPESSFLIFRYQSSVPLFSVGVISTQDVLRMLLEVPPAAGM